ARAGAMGAQPPPDRALAISRDRSRHPGAAEGGGGRGGSGEALAGADPDRLLGPARRRPDPGRGGPALDRRRLLHRAARRPRARARGLLADAGPAARRGGPRGGGAGPRGAVRRPPAPRPPSPGAGAPRAPARRPGHGVPRLMLTRAA